MKLLKALLVLFMIFGCTVKEEEIVEEEVIEEEEEEITINKVSFNAVGDNLIHSALIKDAKTSNGYNFLSYYSEIASFINRADISFVNQESILGGEDLGYSGYPNFNTPDEMADALSSVGFDIVEGCNNHALDKGESAITHAIELFSSYDDLTLIGLREESIPTITVNDITISFLSYTEVSNLSSDSSSIKLMSKSTMKSDVKKAKKISDVIIVSCHWGEEDSTTITSSQKEYAQYLADLGVDVIIGTHSHTLQDVEWLEGKDGNETLVAYSLGNFISGMKNDYNQLGGLLSFNIVEEDSEYSIQDVVLTPIVNHYVVDSVAKFDSTKHDFKVYRLKDYTEELANEHGVNGYNDNVISIEEMIERAQEVCGEGIELDV